MEPTQVAGFNQFFDDGEAVTAWRYGVAVDHKVSSGLYGGAEFSRRDLEVPIIIIGPPRQVEQDNWNEQLARLYLYWIPHRWVALSAEYQYESFKRDAAAANPEQIATLHTNRVPIAINLFHPSGLGARLRATYVNQDGRLGDATGTVVSSRDQFWVVDASISYRLPNRWGIVSLEARNLLDQQFPFQDYRSGQSQASLPTE